MKTDEQTPTYKPARGQEDISREDQIMPRVTCKGESSLESSKRRSGTPSQGMTHFSEADAVRFAKKVSTLPTPSGCLLWLGWTTPDGYGRFKHKLKNIMAHRVAYFLDTGVDPGVLLVRHSCDTPGCCNPRHLIPGTAKDNVRDKIERNRCNHPTGDRSGRRRHPERYPRGDDHPARKHPEWLKRGDAHWSRLHPEKLARGERSGARLHPERYPCGDKHHSRIHPEKYQGEKNASSKLTEADILAIRSDQRNLREIANEYSVSKSTLSKIKLRKSWRHVSPGTTSPPPPPETTTAD